LLCSWKTKRSSALTSRSTSRRIVSFVFFLRRPGVFDRPGAADLLIDLDESPAQFLIGPKTGDLAFGFTYAERRDWESSP
jgi:hypothetical protein